MNKVLFPLLPELIKRDFVTCNDHFKEYSISISQIAHNFTINFDWSINQLAIKNFLKIMNISVSPNTTCSTIVSQVS